MSIEDDEPQFELVDEKAEAERARRNARDEPENEED